MWGFDEDGKGGLREGERGQNVHMTDSTVRTNTRILVFDFMSQIHHSKLWSDGHQGNKTNTECYGT